MNNINTKPVRISRNDAAALRAKFAARRAEDEIKKEVAEIKADLREKFVGDGELLRREMLSDSRQKGARPGGGDRYQGLGGFDETLLRK
jgi:hypothetical protein